MKTLRHFVVRDLKDTAVLWAILGVISVIGGLASFTVQSGPQSFGSNSILGYTYFFCFLIYLAQVWNGAFGRVLSREYLLSLPISRTRMFWIMWARSLVGIAPMVIYTFVRRERILNFAFLGRTMGDLSVVVLNLLFVVWLAGLVVLLMALFSSTQSNQAALMSGTKQKRYGAWFKHFVQFGVDSLFLLLWCASFIQKFAWYGSLLSIVACVAYAVLKIRISYVKWMWGVDAKVWRGRG